MWLSRITSDLGNIPDFLDHFRVELVNAQIEVAIKGNLERNLSTLPGITEYRFGQLQTVESVLNYLNIKLKKLKNKHFRLYLEKYAKALTSRDAEKYSDGESFEDDEDDTDLVLTPKETDTYGLPDGMLAEEKDNEYDPNTGYGATNVGTNIYNQ